MGHEAAGTVERVGESVTRWRPGQRVTFDSTVYCGTCAYCRAGKVNLCDNRTVLGVSCEDYRQHGALAEYVAVPEHIVYELPDGLGFDQAAMVEPVSVAVHAANRAEVKLGQSVAVIGAGVIGLLAIQALRAAGAGTIIAADLDPGRLALAGRLGADVTLKADEVDVAAEVLARTGGRGADVAVEVVGLPQTVEQAFACAGKGGKVVLVGNITPRVELPLQVAVTRELAVLGSCASCGEYPACLDLMQRGSIQVDPLISATAPLSEGPQWFQRLHDREEGLVKVLLQP
jgi:L-iditol 2-dehydrogenase